MKKAISLILAFVILVTSLMQSHEISAASIPALDATVTQENVMAILNTYDSNGAYLLNYTAKKGDNILSWWSDGERIMDELETAVHEECHSYTFMNVNNPASGESIYIGKKKCIQVPYTDIFKTKKMAKSIPKKLRLQRYDTYIAKPVPYLASNEQGVYGLLNEFTAYCWGMNTIVAMCSYFDRFADTPEVWSEYFNMSGGSVRLAHMEFRYYILHYLFYAKKHYPKIYKKILKNKKFVKAFCTIEKKYAKLDKQFDKNLKKIEKKLTKNGYRSEYAGDTFWIYDKSGRGQGVGFYLNEYQAVKKELKKSKYQKIWKAVQKKSK